MDTVSPHGPRSEARARFALAVLVAVYASAYSWMSWRRFATFHASIDATYYLRLLWGPVHGLFDLPLVAAPHALALHFEPVLAPFALLHALGAPLAPMLFVAQAAAAALLAVPAFRLARRRLDSPGSGLVCAVAALLYPTVTVATLHDFHPITLALPLLLGAIDALDEGRRRRALVLGGLALACREDVALALACLAAAEAFRVSGRARAAAIAIAAALVAGFLVFVLLVQPPLLPDRGSYALHFGRLGGETVSSAAGLLRAAAEHPLDLLGRLATRDRLLYPAVLLWPVAFLSLLAPRVLVAALPVFLINLFSEFPRVRTIEAHYATALAPIIVGSAIVGAGRLSDALSRRFPRPSAASIRASVAALLLASSTVAHALHGGSPLAFASTRWRDTRFTEPENAAAIRNAIRAVPPDASVSAAPGILAHLAERPRALCLPWYDDGRPVEVVVEIVPIDE